MQCCCEDEFPDTERGQKCRKVCCNAASGEEFLPQLYKRWSELFTSAFGLIAALAWNSAVQELIEETDLKQQQKFYYAAGVTGAAVLVAYMMEVGGQLLTIGWGAAMSTVHTAGDHMTHREFKPSASNERRDAAAVYTTMALNNELVGKKIDMRTDFSHVVALNEWSGLMSGTE